VNRRYLIFMVPLLCGSLCGCASALREPDELPALPQATTSDAGALLLRAQRLYDERSLPRVAEAAQLWLQAADADSEGVDELVGAMRAFVWLADHEELPEVRSSAARQAVDAGQRCEQRESRSPECLYWMAISLGVQARERRSTGLDAVDLMVERLQSVIELEPGLDHGGPHRVLALVYLRAPAWPTGPGDPDLGLDEARSAIALAPGYPPNRLCLAEALVATEDPEGGRRAYEAAAELARKWVERSSPDAQEWLEEAERYLDSTRNRIRE
jgi:hypothetical protein